ncbi:hypothetical protein BDY19DRAFT_906252 [Irpex rosettiformis]|uniref:Uncharacterized protein n=1 Tax=Irpex rosettiformis TaxID=378272 RepID=A0ACB8U336_9APHY|nr:hypothetical protein BDY19DRAFT_906252 [Irpex rosettiformis]
MSQQRQVTDTRHNDYVGSGANTNRIPGTDQMDPTLATLLVLTALTSTFHPRQDVIVPQGVLINPPSLRNKAPGATVSLPYHLNLNLSHPLLTLARGIGKPWGGQTSAELHHNGHTHRKRGLQGTDKYGTADDSKRGEGADPRVGEEGTSEVNG